VISLYFDQNFAGQSVLSLIAANDWTDLLDLEGVNQAILYLWNGAYKTSIIPTEQSSILSLFTYPEFFLDRKFQRKPEKTVFVFSIRALVTATF
jgi:hypothetical protein